MELTWGGRKSAPFFVMGHASTDTPRRCAPPLSRGEFLKHAPWSPLERGARQGGVCWLAVFFVFLLGTSAACALDSEPAPLASQSLLLDIARAGPRLVAVGDRGHVLLSDDEGRTWRQVIAPTRAMLTGVSFGDDKHGWAVGHDGVILATADGGQTWSQPVAGQDLDTVFLDVFFSDPLHGLAVGAYGKCLLTLDGGKSWQPAATIPDEVHINQIAPASGDTVYLAGETGTLLFSADARTPWQKLVVPYEGSLFGVLPLGGKALLTYGLRGHVFVSENAGATWTSREIPVPVLIMAGVRFKSGVIVLAGLGGNFSLSRDGGRTFEGWKPAAFTGGVAGLLETADGALLAVGESGVVRLQIPEASKP